MAKIICTQEEYDRLSTVLSDNPQFLKDVSICYDIVQESPTIPKDYIYDTETEEFTVYRNKYTGDEIHVIKDPATYLVGPATEKEKFSALFNSCHIEHEVTSDGIELEVCALEGDGYLFIKFYEDGKFQEFVHYPE